MRRNAVYRNMVKIKRGMGMTTNIIYHSKFYRGIIFNKKLYNQKIFHKTFNLSGIDRDISKFEKNIGSEIDHRKRILEKIKKTLEK